MDCTFRTDTGRFNLRVGAIILQDQKLLMVKNARDPYYYSVGGRVRLHETMDEAILREVSEETGLQFEINNLGFIHENFFVMQPSGEVFHEISAFYYMRPLENLTMICKSFTEEGIEEQLAWIPLAEKHNFEIYPRFFLTESLQPDQSIRHIVDRQYSL